MPASGKATVLSPAALRAAGVVLHRWLGLIIGLVFVIVGLTGAILAYAPELKGMMYPVLDGPAPQGWEQRRADVLARIVEANAPRATLVRFPNAQLRAYEIYLADGAQEYRDALTGESVLVRTPFGDILGVAHELHTELLLGHDGEVLLGWLGVAMLVLLLTGIWLWWPRRGTWRFVFRKPRSRALVPQFLWWHKTVGVLSLATLFFVTLTGVAMVFYATAQALLLGLFGGSVPDVPRTLAHPADHIEWHSVVETLDAALPEGQTVYFYPPQQASDALRFRKRMPGEMHPNGLSFVVITPEGERQHAHDATGLGTGVRMTQSIYPLHSGYGSGELWRVVVFLMGIAPVFFFVTGAWPWLRRVLYRRTGQKGA